MAELTTTTVATDRGIDIEVRSGGSGPPLIWFHGLVGLAHREPTLELLADSFTVHAPIWPGYGEIPNESSVEDMLDFALLGWDIVDALQVDALQVDAPQVDALQVDAPAGDAGGAGTPHLVGHSFGAMIAAEMACIARHDLAKLVLVAPFGLWVDDHPITDPFAQLPFQLTELLFTDPDNASMLLTPGSDMSSDEGLAQFMVSNSRRLGTAGKIMFPIPNRRLSKRLYRVVAPTEIIMAEDDRLIGQPYGPAWQSHIARAGLRTIKGAGHMVNLEAPEPLAQAVAGFLTS